MSAPDPRRPVWRYMGWWKWPSLGLLLFCAVAIYLYFDRAPGGADDWGEQVFEGRLAGCPVRAGVRQAESGIDALVWIDPGCAWRLAAARIELLSGDGEPLAAHEIGGLPNPDRLRLSAESHTDGPVFLSLTAGVGGDDTTARVRWSLPESADRGAS